MENINNENVLKIKVDCIRIQEKDLEDQVKNIEHENTKSAIIVGFIGAMSAIIPDGKSLSLYPKTIIVVSFLLTVWLALYNIFSKSVSSHRNIDGCFVDRTNQYEAYLNSCHLTLRKNYQSVSDLLKRKICLTWLAYISATVGVATILVIKLF